MAFKFKLLAATLSLLSVSACTIIPGSHYEGIDSGAQVENLEKILKKLTFKLLILL